MEDSAAHLTGTLKVDGPGRVVIVTDRPQLSKRDAEIESIRRTLYNALDKLDRLQRQPTELTST